MQTTSNMATTGPILMVDDNETDRMIAQRCYQRTGIPNEFRTLESGSALLTHLDEVAAGRAPAPAVILLDINMPGLGGFEVLERLRARPRPDDFVVVMLTNSDDPRDGERARQGGADRLMVKPMRVDQYTEFFQSLVA
ncbi:MAG: response regulator [Planctomycetota bacterium]